LAGQADLRVGGLQGPDSVFTRHPPLKPLPDPIPLKIQFPIGYSEVARRNGVTILGLGGIRTASGAIEFILAGASAVGIGTANFIEPGCAPKVIDGIKDYCVANGVASIKELTGSLRG
ncbi:MAG: hypothetical protein FJ399_04990, partial [Verrucomicrobia bacterium]|nr:hypothetical protein [Verrucomicrobiota bacterium]